MSNEFISIEAFVSSMVWWSGFFFYSEFLQHTVTEKKILYVFLGLFFFLISGGSLAYFCFPPDAMSSPCLQSGCILYFVPSTDVSVVCGGAFLAFITNWIYPVLACLGPELPCMCVCWGGRTGAATLLSAPLLMPIQRGKGMQPSGYRVKYQSCNFYWNTIIQASVAPGR